MAKPKNKKRSIKDLVANQCLKPRRSIPIAEVNELIEKAERRIKSSLTIYDDRIAVLNQLKDNKAYIEHLEDMLHEAKLRNKSLNSDLAQINLAIKRQLELDGE